AGADTEDLEWRTLQLFEELDRTELFIWFADTPALPNSEAVLRSRIQFWRSECEQAWVTLAHGPILRSHCSPQAQTADTQARHAEVLEALRGKLANWQSRPSDPAREAEKSEALRKFLTEQQAEAARKLPRGEPGVNVFLSMATECAAILEHSRPRLAADDPLL